MAFLKSKTNSKKNADAPDEGEKGSNLGIFSRALIVIAVFFTNRKVLKTALITCVCVFVISAAYLGYIFYIHSNQQRITDSVNDLFDEAQYQFALAATPAPALPTPASPSPTPETLDEPVDEPEESEKDRERRLLLEAEAEGRLKYADILAINPDFYGMIEIPGVIERQPYVLSRDNAEYLNTDFNGKRSFTGTIFMNMYNDRLLTDNNSVFFGHYTDTGSMFAKLLNYKKAGTFSRSPVIKLDSLTGESTWVIFAAHVVEPDGWWMIPYANEDDYAAHLSEIKKRSLFNTNVNVNSSDRIITLSVCDYTYEDMRFVVHARRLRPDEKVPSSVSAQTNHNRKGYVIPHLNKLVDVDMSNVAISANPFNNNFFYYKPLAGKVERYSGDSREVQGPFGALTDSGIYENSFMAAAIISASGSENPRSAYLAVQDLGGERGITLFTAGISTGSLHSEGRVTPGGVNARYPAIQNIGGALWLYYSVPGDYDSSEIYRQRILGGDREFLYTVRGVSNAHPLGLRSSGSQSVLIWYEPSSGEVNTASLGTGEEIINVGNVGKDARVTLYGSFTGTSVSCITEIGGKVSFGTIDLSGIPTPPPKTELEDEPDDTPAPEEEPEDDAEEEQED